MGQTEYKQIKREIQDLQKDAITNFWKIGERLNVIKESKLFLFEYKFFEEFLEHETMFHRRSAYRYMQFAKEIDVTRVAHFTQSLRRWDAILPLKEEQRKEVIKRVEQIHKSKGHVTQQDFETSVELAKADITDEKYKEYFEINMMQKRLLSTFEELKEDLKVYHGQFERIRKEKDFQEYPKKKNLLYRHHEVIRNSNLT